MTRINTEIGRTISGITKNPKSTSFIFQAISMAVQRGNIQCVQGAYGESAFEELDEIFYIVQPNSIFKISFDLMNKNIPASVILIYLTICQVPNK